MATYIADRHEESSYGDANPDSLVQLHLGVESSTFLPTAPLPAWIHDANGAE